MNKLLYEQIYILKEVILANELFDPDALEITTSMLDAVITELNSLIWSSNEKPYTVH